MKILVACEESQEVCKAFRAKGHEAYSCDIQECSGGHPEWHIMTDVLAILNGYCTFVTMDKISHNIETKWDMIIAHPPCTRLCNSGQRWLYYGDIEYQEKKKKEQEKAIKFFMKFILADCEHIAVENPMGIMSTLYRKPDCIYNPYDFIGETECKKTCLWLKGLPPLVPTQNITKEQRTHGIWKAYFNHKQYAWNDPMTAKMRSKTPSGVAKAMADQWNIENIKNFNFVTESEEHNESSN